MQYLVSSELDYAVSFPSTLILNIQAQRSVDQTVLEETLSIEPSVRIEEFLIVNGTENRFIRLQTGKRKELRIRYSARVETNIELVPVKELENVPIAELDRQAIPFLFPSRYCQSDKLSRLAWDLFGQIINPLERVTAIVEWIHKNVEYALGSTDSGTSAFDTVTQRTGVCRDFAHLGIALCRALNIPARYFTGYAYQLDPPDFHACFEAFIGDRWLVFDATRLSSPNGLVRIGTGRDAAEAAVASIFGRVRSTHMKVNCELVPGQKFTPLSRQQLKNKGVALDASKSS